MKKIFRVLPLFILMLLAAGLVALRPGSGWATATDWVTTDFSQVRLIAASNTVGTGDHVKLGLHFKLKKDWKIYWRSPGDAGFPPQLDWAGSKNLKQADFKWPTPVRFSILGFETLGYKDEVVFPITANLSDAAKPLRLNAKLDYLACKDICIPFGANLALNLDGGSGDPSNFTHLINRYEVTVPGNGSAHGLSFDGLEATGSGKKWSLRLAATAAVPFSKPDVYVEGPEELRFAPPKVRFSNDGRQALFEVPVQGVEELKDGLVGSKLVLTLADGNRSAEQALTVAAAGTLAAVTGASAGSAPAETAVSLWLILGLAVIGGLILNLMPCVLPVLSIKLLGAIKHGGGEPRIVRLSFLASAAGIVFAFLVLAGALIGLKAGGAAVGWGIQFQHPWFLVAMTVIVTLFACNLWGFFEVRLPGWVSDMGEHTSHVHGLGGHFLTGAFATLLATPCSAPFLGTAVGFALSRGAGEIVAVFLALGVGLALPYLLVAAAPRLATMLPKPGAWMVVLRRILGFALAATALWLLTVIASQSGDLAAAVVGLMMAATAAGLYLGHRQPGRFGRTGWAAMAVFAVIAFLTPTLLYDDSPKAAATAKVDSLWTPFDEQAIGGLVAKGRTVFVDVTADWCLTCQVNKALVLSKGEIFEELSGNTVIPMQADWTKPSDAISRYLASFGRYGIPFNAAYGPGAPRGIPLPELLSAKEVKAALRKASGDGSTAAR